MITEKLTKIIDYFRRPPLPSAQCAKERLQIIIAHERSLREKPEYFPQLQRDLLAVISKYVNVNDEDIKVELEQKGDCAILELNITLPT